MFDIFQASSDHIQIFIDSVNDKLSAGAIAAIAAFGLLSAGGAYISYDTTSSASSDPIVYEAPAQQ